VRAAHAIGNSKRTSDGNDGDEVLSNWQLTNRHEKGASEFMHARSALTAQTQERGSREIRNRHITDTESTHHDYIAIAHFASHSGRVVALSADDLYARAQADHVIVASRMIPVTMSGKHV